LESWWRCWGKSPDYVLVGSNMANGQPWTHDELMLAMNLYCKRPFGQLRHGNPLIIEVAKKLGRTQSSLSMKLCNLASLDDGGVEESKLSRSFIMLRCRRSKICRRTLK
jgi:hypothetical protein